MPAMTVTVPIPPTFPGFRVVGDQNGPFGRAGDGKSRSV
jgi:hypothetical protein